MLLTAMSEFEAVVNLLCERFRNLSSVQDREICCYSISCKEQHNIGTSQNVSDCKCIMFNVGVFLVSLFCTYS